MEHYQVRVGARGIEGLADELAAGVAEAVGRPQAAAGLAGALANALRRVLSRHEECGRSPVCDRALGGRPWRDAPSAADEMEEEPEVARFVLYVRHDLEDLLWRLAELAWRELRALDPRMVVEAELLRANVRGALRRDLGRRLYAHPLCQHDPICAGTAEVETPLADEWPAGE